MKPYSREQPSPNPHKKNVGLTPPTCRCWQSPVKNEKECTDVMATSLIGCYKKWLLNE